MRIPVLLGLGLLLTPGLAAAQSMRCDHRVISVGDTTLELRARCGAPDHVSQQTRLVAEGVIAPRTRHVASTLGTAGPDRLRRTRRGPGRGVVSDVRYVKEPVELWTYKGESGDLTRVVVIRRGKVYAIETLGRTEMTRNPNCERWVSRGTRTGTVRLSCGQPADVARWQEERVVTRADGFEARVLVEHERWTYDPGPGRFLRILHFVNGKLVKVETGGRSPS